MSRVRADNYVNSDGTGSPNFPHGAVVVGVVTATSFEGDGSALTGTGIGATSNVTTTGTVQCGILSVTTGADMYGYKVESGTMLSGDVSGVLDYVLQNGHVQKRTGITIGNYGVNFRTSPSKTVDSTMEVTDVITTTLMVPSTTHYLDGSSIQIDGSTSNLDIDYVGGSAPSSANGSGFDIYTFTIQKTASTPAYHIIVNAMGAN